MTGQIAKKIDEKSQTDNNTVQTLLSQLGPHMIVSRSAESVPAASIIIVKPQSVVTSVTFVKA
jgi:hypothetical protein